MTMTITTPAIFAQSIWTYSDYEELGEYSKGSQIIEGVLYMVPSPTSFHQRISRNLESILWDHVKKNDLGEIFYAPMDVILSSTDVVQPDIFFISKKRLNLIQERGIFGAPDMVVEILFDSTRNLDLKIKKELYEKHGVAEYIILDPAEKKATQYVIESGRYQLKGTYPSRDRLSLHTVSLEIDLQEIF